MNSTTTPTSWAENTVITLLAATAMLMSAAVWREVTELSGIRAAVTTAQEEAAGARRELVAATARNKALVDAIRALGTAQAAVQAGRSALPTSDPPASAISARAFPSTPVIPALAVALYFGRMPLTPQQAVALKGVVDQNISAAGEPRWDAIFTQAASALAAEQITELRRIVQTAELKKQFQDRLAARLAAP